MGTTLTGTFISQTFDALIKVTDNDNLTSTAKRLTDGLGNDSPLFLSTTKLGVGVTPTTTFQVSGNSQLGGNLTVTGNLIVQGTTTTVDTDTLSVKDPLIIVGSDNTSSDAVDLGFYGVYDTSGSLDLYAGLFRDASDAKFHLFKDLQTEPTTTVNKSGTGYTKAGLVIGGLEATSGSFTGNIELEAASGFAQVELGGPSGAIIDLKGPFSDDFDLRILSNTTSGQINALNGQLDITANTNINLQHQGSTKLQTLSTGVNITGNLEVSGYLQVDGAIKDSSGDTGNSGQILSSTGSGTNWIDNDTGTIDGSGTANDVVMWQDSDTLTDAPIAISGNNATFAGDVTLEQAATPTIELKDTTNNYFLLVRHNNTNAIFDTHSSSYYEFKVGDVEKMRLTSSAATFADRVIIGDDAITTDKPGLVVGDTTNGGQITIRGLSPTLFFDKTGSNNPKILTDGGLLEIKSGTLDSEGSVLMSLTGSAGNATFAGTIKQTGKTLTIEANDPEIILKDTDEGTDDKVFRIINVSEELRFTARNDNNDGNADGGDVLKITRSGNSTFAGSIIGTSAQFIDTSNPDGGSGTGEGGSVIIEGRRDGTANLLSLRSRDASAPTVALPNGQGGIIRFQGFDGTDFAQMGGIQVVADGQAVANGDAPSKMNFYTVPDGSETLTVALALDKSQNATFAGKVSAFGNSDTVPAIDIYSDSNHGLRILHRATDGDFSFERRVSGTNTEFLRIGRSTGNATFAGDVTVSGGDINASNIQTLVSGGSFRIKNNGGTTIATFADNQNTTFSSDVEIGVADSGERKLKIHGGASGTPEGGQIELHTAADHDSTYAFYRIDAYEDDLRIGRAGTTDITLQSTGNVFFGATVNIAGNCELGANNINFADNGRARFGNSADLQISHNGTDSQITNLTGHLQFTNTANDKDITFATDDGSGGDAIYITIDGSATTTVFSKNTRHDDSVLLQVGSGNDAAFYHNATDTFLTNSTGHLKIRQFADDKDIIFESDNGSGGTAVYFQIDGSAELNKFIKNSKHPDDIRAIFGDSNDLVIYHDGSNSYIDEGGTGGLKLESNSFIDLQTSNGAAFTGRFINGGAVELYHNGSKKFETTSTGISVTGGATFSSTVTANDSIVSQADDAGFIARNAAGTVIGTMGAESSSTPNVGKLTVRNNGNTRVNFNSNGDSYITGGDFGIGTTSPNSVFEIQSSAPEMTIGNSAINQFESGRIRFTEQRNASAGLQGGYIHYDGSANKLHIGMHNTSDTTVSNDANAITILRSNQDVGIGTDSPNAKLQVRIGGIGSNANDEVDGVIFEGDRHDLIYKQIRTGATSDWNSTTLRLQTRVDTTLMSSIDFVTDASFQRHIDINTASNSFNTRFTHNGRVGIGTTSPSQLLTIGDSSGNSFIDINKSTSGENGIIFNNAGNRKCAIIQNSSEHLEFHTNNNNVRMIIEEGGNVGIATTSPSYKLDVISVGADAINVGAGNDFSGVRWSGDSHAFSWRIGGDSFFIYDVINAAQRVTIDDSGNFGIGTSSPSHKLHVVSAGNGEIKAERTSGAAILTQAQSALGRFGTTTNHNLQLMTNSNTGITINTSGNVGIGTTSPDYKLHIERTGDVMMQLKATDSNQSYMKFVNSTTGDGKFTDGLLFGLDTDESCVFWNFEATPLRFATSGTERMRIDSSGNLGLGNTSPSQKLHVTGTILASSDVIAFSDKKLKENIKTLDGSKVYDMRGVSFTRKDTGKDSSGVIAQEIQKIAPELVNDNDGTLSVAYGNLTGYLIEAIKELKQEVEELKKQIK